MQIKLFDRTTVETTPETFHADACKALQPWCEKSDRVVRFPHDKGFVYYVRCSDGELTDACAFVDTTQP